MINVNEYFGGNVKSLGMETPDGRATLGVMKPGEYEFGTSTVEYMTVVYGTMMVMFPGSEEWQPFTPFETFRVEKDVKFRVKVTCDTGYLCTYK